MNKNELKEYLADFQQRSLPFLIERELIVKFTSKIVSIIGPRRAGKTYFLYQQMKQLLQQGVAKTSLLYLNLEDPRLIGITFKDIREIIKIQWELYPAALSKLYLFIDEPQNVPKWEIAIRSLHDEGFIIWITGSSSKLLSKEIATSLRGRTLSYPILPFSFREFLRIKRVSFDFKALSSPEKSKLGNLLQEYLIYGGFPEIIQEADPQIKLKIIEEYLNLIIYKDIVERYKLRNSQLVKWLIKAMISSFSKELSIHKLYLTLKSQGVKVSKNTLYMYISILEDSFFGLLLPKFSYSIRKKELGITKLYLSDISFFKLIETTADSGRVMENMVFLELFRRKKPLMEIFYWKNQQQEEVDFVVKEKKSVQLIQVCTDISNPDTKKRELRALHKASDQLRCSDLLIITPDYEGQENLEEKKVVYIPLWKWLMNLK